MHPGAHTRPVGEGFPFLGFVVFPPRRRLKRRNGVRFARRLRAAVAAHGRGERATTEVGAMVRGWVNHARYGCTRGLRRAVLSTVRLSGPGERDAMR